MSDVEAVVVGAGVVGLAVARALSQAGLEVLVLEAEPTFGTITSARNSEVIHAGIYYPTGSLKALTCVDGKHRLYRYCDERGIDYKRCGKLIVATNEAQKAQLEAIQAKAEANGVEDLELMDGQRVAELEPAVNAVAALLSPSTGMVDSHGFMLALLGDAETAGSTFAFRAPVRRLAVDDQIGLLLDVGGDEPMQLTARYVINAAGLDAPNLARACEGIDRDTLPTAHFCKGNYFTLAGRSPFSRLIYPVPEAAGLGVHVTVDLGGQARFGPDTEWIKAIDYDVDPSRAEAFYAAIRTYYPALEDGALAPDYSGIRPKLGPEGTPAADFVIQGPEEHGVAGLSNLFGIESPGLTASLALAGHVFAKLDR
ncbi:MAG: NAD(P)/FAD-dependent oxidoreductase [Geminicoccaceae bacterium]